MAALIVSLPCQPQAQLPIGIGKVNQTLRRNLEGACLIVHMAMQLLSARRRRHSLFACPRGHVRVGMTDGETGLASRVGDQRDPSNYLSLGCDAHDGTPRASATPEPWTKISVFAASRRAQS